MAHVLSLIYGATSSSLVASGCYLNNFSPKPGTPDAASVTDTIAVTLKGTSPIDVRNKRRAIESFFSAARKRQQWRSGDKVFLQFQLSTDATTYRSEVLDGRLELVEDSVQEAALNYLECVIYVTRRPYWEGALTALEIGNGSGLSVSNLTIYNHDDAAANHDNYGLITDSQIGGTLATPLRVEIKNLGTRQIKNVHISLDSVATSAESKSHSRR